jgi:peptidyl-prolyl cis-trans isomerase B (cyclophilin B)
MLSRRRERLAVAISKPRDTDGGSCHWFAMKTTLLSCLAGIALVAITARSQDTTPTPSPTMTPSPSPTANEVAVIKTSEGEMVAEFWPDVAPNTVENFKKLARQGFYDGTAFHRIVKGFMIQGGDPLTKDASKESRWGTGDPGYKVKAEFNKKSHERGVLSMARSSDPDSAGSQFFICLANVNRLDGQYTTFGKVIKGDDVLGKLGDTEVTMSAGGEKSKPTTRVAVESIKIVPADSVK